MQTDINVMDFINRKLIYNMYLSGFAKALVESGIYLTLSDKARKEIVEYSEQAQDVFGNPSSFSLIFNAPEFIHLFINDIFAKKTLDFILSTRPTEFLNIRETIRKAYANYKNSFKEFEKISEIINIQNIKM